MADKTQHLMWTVLPNGLNPGRTAYRVSVLVTPQLTLQPGVSPVLGEFPDFTDWPDVLSNSRFRFRYAGLSIEAAPVSRPDSGVWRNIFPPETAVISHSFEDRRDDVVLSYPVDQVGSYLADFYAEVMSESPDDMPTTMQLMRKFSALVERLPEPADMIKRLRDPDFEPDPDDPRDAFGLLQAYHRPLEEETLESYSNQGPLDPREDSQWRSHKLVDLPKPEAIKDIIDFHRIVASANQYRGLLRLLGLVLDFELPLDEMPDGAVTDRLSVAVSWPATGDGGVETLPDTSPNTATRLEPKESFAPALKDASVPIRGGFLRLDDNFSLIQVDVDGGGIKVKNFAQTLPTIKGGSKRNEDAKAGTPALRTAGFLLVQNKRGKSLKKSLERSGELNDAEQAGSEVNLFQEDLVRGYHVDVFDESTGRWQSLCRRDGLIDIVSTFDDVPVVDEEGMVRLGATQSADGSQPGIVKLYEGLFAWTGWSLTAPAPGRGVATDRANSVRDLDNTAAPGMPFESRFSVHPGSLPSLRFGREYGMRVRIVDLAHNAVDPSTDAIEPPGAARMREPYLRYEPVEPPALALGKSAGVPEKVGDGEAMARLAIRTFNPDPANNTVPSGESARRHVAPARTSAKQAETHGMVDAGGKVDPAAYPLLSSRDAPLEEATISMDGVSTVYSVCEDGFTLPYLPDPFGHEVAVRFIGPASVGPSAIPNLAYYRDPLKSWPDAQPVQLQILEDPGAEPDFDPDRGVLRVPLAKADIVTLRLSHVLPSGALEQMGVWRWYRDRFGSQKAHSVIRQLALRGYLWMLTPWIDIELVHAVQKPLVTPQFIHLHPSKGFGKTFANLGWMTRLDARSTEKLDVFGRWNEPEDDLAKTGPENLMRRGHAVEVKLDYPEGPAPADFPTREFARQRHEYGDTRYRRVLYRMEATSRFREFMPPAIRNAGGPDGTNDQIKVVSDEAVRWVENSAPPPPPEILYVIPTFGWTRTTKSGETTSWRDGGGLRVYLNRPWFVTGHNEMLAVVLPSKSASPAELRDRLKPHVTQWGTDPIWGSVNVTTAAPSLAQFPLAVTAGPLDPARLADFVPDEEAELPPGDFKLSGLVNPSLPADSPVRLEVAPHVVGYDSERELWFADIVVNGVQSYTPFIRLALARYHPVSVDGAHLSPVVTTEFVQLTPDRLAVVRSAGGGLYRVGVYGYSYESGPGATSQSPMIELTVERMDPAIDTDLGWRAVADAAVEEGDFEPVKPVRPLKPKLKPLEPIKQVGRKVEPVIKLSKELLARGQELLAKRRFDEILLNPDLIAALRPPAIWEGSVRLPEGLPEDSRLRLMIKEFELHQVDTDHVEESKEADPRLRLVYAEAVSLEPANA